MTESWLKLAGDLPVSGTGDLGYGNLGVVIADPLRDTAEESKRAFMTFEK